MKLNYLRTLRANSTIKKRYKLSVNLTFYGISMLVTRILILLFLLFSLISCEKTMQDATELNTIELRKKWRECAYISSPSNNQKQICNQYEKECNDRKDKGNLVCY
jgi:hypothetical protein